MIFGSVWSHLVGLHYVVCLKLCCHMHTEMQYVCDSAHAKSFVWDRHRGIEWFVCRVYFLQCSCAIHLCKCIWKWVTCTAAGLVVVKLIRKYLLCLPTLLSNAPSAFNWLLSTLCWGFWMRLIQICTSLQFLCSFDPCDGLVLNVENNSRIKF